MKDRQLFRGLCFPQASLMEKALSWHPHKEHLGQPAALERTPLAYECWFAAIAPVSKLLGRATLV